ncbi:type I-U CRISPR-associated helicase/endonuclease Cas3 [Pseudonocardia sp. C8]|uniref:type I-G CRISPR-associated helicase/endonuclease Cas3g n=1 Tax=Pseudonocardia sp. C8 TaxID=2762759 RepID=UPI0016428DAD|nr:type I-U CRISPR-associated helicase/endonuclease Cas3 [Pseudonocardia sp. C8]MBC3189990.1 type I-U CRISPR-associated helicase/endonuclease Cas3 [Pseudonocardia sp. C8]
MRLNRGDFAAYFAALHEGSAPYAWQERLLDSVLDAGRWPEALVAPTGAGKTSVIDVHVFAHALAAARGLARPPRRLAMIVARRVLVDDQYRYACRLAEELDSAQEGVLAEVAHRLRAGRAGADQVPLLVARLRGGEPPSRRWVDHPTAVAVLCATPEMWGSRLLFRGYGSSSRAWPREAGLLALDTVAVLDEAHLSRQLLCTARRVAQLVPVADHAWEGPPPLQVVETTATPASGEGRRLGVDETDLADGSSLRERLCRPKPISLVPRKDWRTTRPRHTVVDEIARRAVELIAQADREHPTVGCFVNTVERAVALTAALRDKRIGERPLRVVMLCGQVRPVDVELLETRYPRLLTPAGNSDVDVLVSTQTLEVGADLDLHAIVTELASGTALVQRAGRANRRGLAAAGPVVVIVPDGDVSARDRSGPYDSDDLSSALAWLTGRAEDELGLAPWAVRGDPPPQQRHTRRLLQRLELGQVWHWDRTSDQLAAEPELDLWLSDDLRPETSISLVVRDDLPTDSADAVEQIRVLLPRRHEAFGVPIQTAAEILSEELARLRTHDRHAQLPAVLVRGDDVGPLTWTGPSEQQRARIRPGDVVVLSADLALFTPGEQGSPSVAVTESSGIRRARATDVLEAIAHRAGGPRTGEIVHRVTLADPALIDQLAPIDDPVDDAGPPVDPWTVAEKWLTDHQTDKDPMAAAAAGLLAAGDRRAADVVVLPSHGPPRQLVVIDGRRRDADDSIRQEWTPASGRVTLAAHQRDVAERSGELAAAVGLPAPLTSALTSAALHHDDGKADPRFQVRLGGRPAGPPLAKSHGGVGPETQRRRQDRSGLPPRWRHEQRSVIDAWPHIGDTNERDLVARLIGSTHGHGRTSFPHTASELLGPGAGPVLTRLAEELFDAGGWDELIERTRLRHGVWCCAYVEALLRAADGQISGEGR